MGWLRKLFGMRDVAEMSAGETAAGSSADSTTAEAAQPDDPPGDTAIAAADDNDDDNGDDVDDDDNNSDEVLRQPELEAELRAAPRDAARFLVYADWLQHHDDPRGEWILLEHALTEADPATRAELRSRRSLLASKHHAHLFGPLELEASASHLGFLRYARIEASNGASAADFEHVAYLLLETLVVNDRDDVAEIRALALEAGRDDIAILGDHEYVPRSDAIERVVATVYVRHERGQRWISMYSDERFGMDGGNHSYLVRMTLESPAGVVAAWSFGSDPGQTEESLGDNGVHSESYPCGSDVTRVTCELRFAIENGASVVFNVGGTAEVVEGAFELVLTPRPPFRGAPFEYSSVIDRPALQGPALATHNTSRGCAVPMFGAFRSGDELVRLDGTVVKLEGFSPPGHLTRSAACDGVLGAVYSPFSDKARDKSIQSLTSFMRLPDGAPIHRRHAEHVFDLDVLAHHRAVLRGAKRFAVVDTQTSAELWRVELADAELGDALAIVEHADALYVLRDARVTVYTTATGAVLGEFALPGLRVDGRQYGMGALAFHPVPARVAWVLGATTAIAEFGPRMIIGWRDRDGGGGEVAIEDTGWARHDDSFGKCAVLTDGRIIASGTRSVWMVAPPATTAIRIGPTGYYIGRLAIANGRLWNLGPGPAYLDIPAP